MKMDEFVKIIDDFSGKVSCIGYACSEYRIGVTDDKLCPVGYDLCQLLRRRNE